jgi:hypothetical protein
MERCRGLAEMRLRIIARQLLATNTRFGKQPTAPSNSETRQAHLLVLDEVVRLYELKTLLRSDVSNIITIYVYLITAAGFASADGHNSRLYAANGCL